MARPLGNDTVTRLRAALVRNPRGNNLERDWENASELEIPHCSVQATKLSDKLRFEDDAEREHQMSFMRLYAPRGSDIAYTDRIEFQGKSFDVQGEPAGWRRMSGREHHVALLLVLREG